MVAVKVIHEKGVDSKIWQKNGKHRIYFTMEVKGNKMDVGNYDIKENSFYSDRRYEGQPWGVVEKTDEAQALIVLGDGDKKILVGPTTKAPTRGNRSDPVQKRITLGMCINNATSIVVARSTKPHLGKTEEISKEVFDLADAMYLEYQTRYSDL